MANKCAKKRGVSKESLILKWKKISDESTEFGCLVHDYFKCLLNKEEKKIYIDDSY